MSDSGEGAAADDSEGDAHSDAAPALGASGGESDGSFASGDSEGEAGAFGETPQPCAARFEQRRVLRARTLHAVRCWDTACPAPICRTLRWLVAHQTLGCTGDECQQGRRGTHATSGG